MNRLLVLTIFLIHSTILMALPGDNQIEGFNDYQAGTCNQDSDGPLSEAAKGIERTIQCQSFDLTQPQKMCKCMANTYGDSIEDDPEYGKFAEKVRAFDSSETAMIEFSHDPVVLEMAMMANFISEQSEAISNPFDSNGVCSAKLKIYEDQVKEKTGVDFDFKPISGFLRGTKISPEVMNKEILEESLSNFFTTARSNDRNTIKVRSEEEVSNPYIQHIYNSLHRAPFEKSTAINIFNSISHDRPLEETHPISKENAIDSLCNGLITRFDEMRKEQLHILPGDTIIDRLNQLTNRDLHDVDVPAFRGLRSRFITANSSLGPSSELYFNQMFCKSFKENESNGSLSRATDPYVLEKSDEQLRNLMIELNAFFETSAEQLKSAEYQLSELIVERSDTEDKLKYLLEKSDLKWEDFKKIIEDLETGSDPVLIFKESLSRLYPNKEIDPDQMKLIEGRLIHFFNIHNEMKEAELTVWGIEDIYEEKQREIDEVTRELLYRKGNMKKVFEFLKPQHVFNRTALFYASYDRSISSNMIGPMLPTYSHISAGNMNGDQGFYTQVKGELENRNLRAQGVLRTLVKSNDDSLSPEKQRSRERAIAAVTSGTYTSRRAGGRNSNLRNHSNLKSSTFDKKAAKVNEMLKEFKPKEVSESDGEQAVKSLERNEDSLNSSTKERRTQEQRILDKSSIAQGLPIQDQINNSPVLPIRPLTTPNEFVVDSTLNNLESRLKNIEQTQAPTTSPNTTNDNSPSEDEKRLLDEISRLRNEVSELRQDSTRLREHKESLKVQSPPEEVSPKENSGEILGSDYAPDSPGANFRDKRRSTGPNNPNSNDIFTEAMNNILPNVPSPEMPVQIQRDNLSSARLEARNINISSAGGLATSELGNFNNIERTLINGTISFSVVEATELKVSPIEVGVDFLSLPDNEKIAYVQTIFRERSEEALVIKQVDGRIVLIERSDAFKPAKSEDDIKKLDSEGVARNQAHIVHRLRSLNLFLDNVMAGSQD